LKLKDASLYILGKNPDGTVNVANPQQVLVRKVDWLEANQLIEYVTTILTQAQAAETRALEAEAVNANLRSQLNDHAQAIASTAKDLKIVQRQAHALQSDNVRLQSIISAAQDERK